MMLKLQYTPRSFSIVLLFLMNVVQMARAKFFRPLQRLFEGPVAIQVIMVETLADLELTDHDKQCLSSDGSLKPLLQMLQLDNTEVKSVAVRALENLSGVATNGLQLIKGAKTPLFELIFCHAVSKLRQHVAKTIMHLAMSAASPEASEEHIRLLETEEEVYRLFSLISYTGPDTQETILLTFHALCKSPSGFDIRRDLRQLHIQFLYGLKGIDLILCVTTNSVSSFSVSTNEMIEVLES